MGKPVINLDSVLVEPSKNVSPGKYTLETGWPSKWYSPPEDTEDELLSALGNLRGLLLPAVQQAEDAPLLVKFVEPPLPEVLAELEGVSQLEPPGAGENGPPLMLKIEGVEGESAGAWGGLSDLIEDPGPILEGPPKGGSPGEFIKLDDIFHKLDDVFLKIEDAIEDELLPEWADVLGNLDPEGLLLPAINGQDSLLFVKVELTEQNLAALKEEESLDDLQILQAGKSGIIGFAEALKVEWTPIDEFELKLEDGGGEQEFDTLV